MPVHGPKSDRFEYRSCGNLGIGDASQKALGRAELEVSSERYVLPGATLAEPHRRQLGLIFRTTVDQLDTEAVPAHPRVEVRDDPSELRTHITRRSAREGGKQLEVAHLLQQASLHARHRGPLLRCLQRKPRWLGQRLVSVGTPHASVKERRLPVDVAVQGSLGDSKRLGHVLHLGAVIAVCDEDIGGAADELLDSFGGDEPRHFLIITDRTSRSRNISQ